MGKHLLDFDTVRPHVGRWLGRRAAAAAAEPVTLAKRAAACTQTQFYKSPTAAQQVNIGQQFDIQWDNTCFGRPTAVDITLLSPNVSKAIHTWASVDFSKGVYSVSLSPTSFESKAKIDVNIQIAVAGDSLTPSFLLPGVQTIPPGPMFKGTYDANNATSNPLVGNSSEQVTIVNNFAKKGMTKGQVAAAVLMPILFVAVCIAGYVWWTRKKEATRRKEYRENLDQRMSIAPGADWAPISAAGAAAAIRHSMALSNVDRNTKASSFFGRGSSVYQVDPPQEMRQRGKASTEQTRTSRISFADSAITGRHGEVPAVPSIPAAYRKSAYTADVSEYNEKEQDTLSPTQRQGAFALDEDSINDRLSGGSVNEKGRPSTADAFGNDLDTMPALAMMRANESPNGNTAPSAPAPAMTRESTAGVYSTYSIGAYSGNTDSIVTESNGPSYFNPPANSSDPDEALRQYSARTPQMVPVTTTVSPFSGFAAGPGLAQAAGFDMGPDAVFRAYAATRPAAPPAVMTNNTGGGSTMRTLYGPTMTQGLGLRPRADTMNSTIGNNNPYRDSMAPSHMSDDVGKAH